MIKDVTTGIVFVDSVSRKAFEDWTDAESESVSQPLNLTDLIFNGAPEHDDLPCSRHRVRWFHAESFDAASCNYTVIQQEVYIEIKTCLIGKQVYHSVSGSLIDVTTHYVSRRKLLLLVYW